MPKSIAAPSSTLILACSMALVANRNADAFGLSAAVAKTAAANTATPLFARQKSKWDDLVDEDDDEIEPAFESKIPVPPDMTYVERNVKRCHENFLNLRNVGGKDLCNDVYAKSPVQKEELWYVGKVAKITDVTLEDCIARQWNIIETHATNLRPIELYPHRGNLELWTAPGDSELEVAYNRPSLVMTKMEKYEVPAKDLKNNLIGFQGEVYQEGEEGFRTWRTEDGSPARAEINPGGETRPPTEEEMEQLQQEMQSQNISVQDVYKESQKRKDGN
eukprot:CAMPEP_0172389806 /NCGR_PEP_ID=MMETSP1061-20121228/6608_1 /TAXON_ID=37318 /ORGANISM="Pseudo-nitzschia pungens, Strain cf. pungens" /LENGTH=275 /DNA_ID=CAMNT_0013120033 /DNA_START=224 /DNA_END=1051 /DNA_ORIENTATION=-